MTVVIYSFLYEWPVGKWFCYTCIGRIQCNSSRYQELRCSISHEIAPFSNPFIRFGVLNFGKLPRIASVDLSQYDADFSRRSLLPWHCRSVIWGAELPAIPTHSIFASLRFPSLFKFCIHSIPLGLSIICVRSVFGKGGAAFIIWGVFIDRREIYVPQPK